MSDKKTEERFILKPSAGSIAVRVEEAEKVTANKLILLSNLGEKPTVGTVVETCDDYEIEDEEYEPLYKKGDIVVFGRFSGTRVSVDRDNFIILNERDILARLIPSDAPSAVEARKVRVSPAVESD